MPKTLAGRTYWLYQRVRTSESATVNTMVPEDVKPDLAETAAVFYSTLTCVDRAET